MVCGARLWGVGGEGRLWWVGWRGGGGMVDGEMVDGGWVGWCRFVGGDSTIYVVSI